MTDEKKEGTTRAAWDEWGNSLTSKPPHDQDEFRMWIGKKGDAARQKLTDKDLKTLLAGSRLRGAPPKHWIKVSLRLVRLGRINGYDHLLKQHACGMFDDLLGPDMAKVSKEILAEMRRRNRARQLMKPERREAASRGGATRSRNQKKKCKEILAKYRTAYPGTRPPVAAVVARWHVSQSESGPPSPERQNAIRRLTRQLQRRNLAS